MANAGAIALGFLLLLMGGFIFIIGYINYQNIDWRNFAGSPYQRANLAAANYMMIGGGLAGLAGFITIILGAVVGRHARRASAQASAYVFSQPAPVTPVPTPQPAPPQTAPPIWKPVCKECNRMLTYIYSQKGWYCSHCDEYAENT